MERTRSYSASSLLVVPNANKMPSTWQLERNQFILQTLRPCDARTHIRETLQSHNASPQTYMRQIKARREIISKKILSHQYNIKQKYVQLGDARLCEVLNEMHPEMNRNEYIESQQFQRMKNPVKLLGAFEDIFDNVRDGDIRDGKDAIVVPMRKGSDLASSQIGVTLTHDFASVRQHSLMSRNSETFSSVVKRVNTDRPPEEPANRYQATDFRERLKTFIDDHIKKMNERRQVDQQIQWENAMASHLMRQNQKDLEDSTAHIKSVEEVMAELKRIRDNARQAQSSHHRLPTRHQRKAPPEYEMRRYHPKVTATVSWRTKRGGMAQEGSGFKMQRSMSLA